MIASCEPMARAAAPPGAENGNADGLVAQPTPTGLRHQRDSSGLVHNADLRWDAARSKRPYPSQPGNVNLDAATNSQDLLALIEAINREPPATLARYNIKPSIGANPVNTQDLFRLIQLLNGINTIQAFIGAAVAECP